VYFCFVCIIATDFRRSDRAKLAPSVRNYDRVIHPSHAATSERPQQAAGVAKTRPGRRGNRTPSSKEVFAVESQTPAAGADTNSSPTTPNGSEDQILFDTRSPPSSKAKSGKGGRGPSKQSKKDDNANAARRLRGKPPELNSYFVVDDDNGARASGSDDKGAANDPFWEANSDAHQSSQRSPAPDAATFFKPRSTENLASAGGGDAAGSETSDIPMNYLLLSTGNIGETSTDSSTPNVNVA